jgi:3'(2'), 5'-bisphosphate nucleotidase
MMAAFDVASLIPAVIEAGACTLKHRAAGVESERKSDESPVTAADREAEAILLAALGSVAPGAPVVAEEEAAAGRIPDVNGPFFLVDPLDGTKEFIKGGDDFTVNVALIEHGLPVCGIVYAPARSVIWWGDVAQRVSQRGEVEDGVVVRRQPISVRPCAGRPKAVASKSHSTPATEAYLAACGAEDRVSVGSSLKFVLVAEGVADLYPRPAPTMEWDTAAGHAVLAAAGGRVFDLDGKPLTYGKPRFFNPGFVASGPYDPPALRPFMSEAQA